MTAHIGDGRAFLESTDKKYDLIVLALPDSLTLVSGNSALRLESFLFTKEAFEAARDHLKPGGVFSLYNYYRTKWLIDRYAGTAQDGVPPHSRACSGSDRRRTWRCSSSSKDTRRVRLRREREVEPGRRGREARDRRPSVRVPEDELDPERLLGDDGDHPRACRSG